MYTRLLPLNLGLVSKRAVLRKIWCCCCCFQVDIYESRKFIGGKVGSFTDKDGNHIEMGLHVFFGCYNNLFRLLTKVYLQLWNFTWFCVWLVNIMQWSTVKDFGQYIRVLRFVYYSLVLLLCTTPVDLNWNKKKMVVWNRLEPITICSSRTTLTLSSTRVEMLEVSWIQRLF